MRSMLVVVLVVGAGAGEGWAEGWELALSRTHPYNVPTPLADSRSPFVAVPARVGFYGGMLAGLVPGVMVGVPLALFDQLATGRTSQFSADVIQKPAIYSGVAMQYAVGGPFYLSKLMFYDLPRGVLGAGRGGGMAQ